MSNASRTPRESLASCTQFEYILLGDLRDLLSEPPTPMNRKWMAAVLDSLLETLPCEFAFKDEGEGYLAEVLEEYPSWSPQVDLLMAERDILFEKLQEVRSQLDARVRFAYMANELKHELREWMNRFVAFHRHERRLLQSAYTLEIGIGD
ncbi:MAG: hypothetical protein O3A00_22380 [Planctomycetota bacterium]|nr:hypothetical protein [Planctomycetota bacterium]